jgi:hypothetical protein
MGLYIAEVKSVYDDADGERIKVRLLPKDARLDSYTEAFPLLPKMLHVKPKVGESVLVLTLDTDNQYSQCFYVGPIISQPQNMNYDSHYTSAGRLLNGTYLDPLKAPSVNARTHGSYADDDEIAVYGRKDTDVILGDKDLRIRCGARKFNMDNSEFVYNLRNPAYIKLKEHDNVINKVGDSDSTTSLSIVADEVNILSHNGDGAADILANQKGEIEDSDDDRAMKKIIQDAHALPYGDELVNFLTMFLQMFKSHTHKYANLPPCPDDASKKLDMKYGSGTGSYSASDYDYTRGTSNEKRFEDASKTFKGLGEKLLSKHVRIN